ncbi:MAG: cellulose synthase operon protein YhjQ/BcsQ [Myxococcota bacterium]
MARSCVVYTASAPLRDLSEKLSEDGVVHLAASVAAPNELLEAVRDHRPDLVLADLGSMPDAVLDLLDKLPTPRPRLIVTGPQDRSGPILRAMRMGVREYIDSPPNEGELRRAVEEVTADLEAAAAADPPAKAIAVMGAKGGCGATTVASQLARALRRTGGRVALIDLNLPLGDVTLHFDIQPAYSVANIARESERLDPTYLRTLLHGPAEGVQILAAPARAEEAELVRGQHVEQVLTLLREDFDWVVLDVSRAWSDTTVRALDLADQILLVTLMDVPTLHHTRQHLDLLERLGHAGERVRLVANRYSKNDSVTDRDLDEFLDRGLDFRIPNAYRTALACVNQGACVSDVAPRSALATAYTQLSEALHEWCGLQVAEEGGSALGRAVRNIFRSS